MDQFDREREHEDEIDILNCTVRSVIFSNEENGYTVLSVTDTNGEEQRVTGTFPFAWPGESITAYAKIKVTLGPSLSSLSALPFNV